MDFIRLNLAAPLVYRKFPPGGPLRTAAPFAEKLLPETGETGGEFLFCFEINPGEAGLIEPDPGRYLGPLIFTGSRRASPAAAPGQAETAGPGEAGEPVKLPAGSYFFTQFREYLDESFFLEAAVELQKQGLWERIKLEDTLYLRRLREDGAEVSQLWRPARLS
jgi:hypothetical protein